MFHVKCAASYLLGIQILARGWGLVKLHDTSTFVLHSQTHICYTHTRANVLILWCWLWTTRTHIASGSCFEWLCWGLGVVVCIKARSLFSFCFPVQLFCLYPEMHTWGTYYGSYLCIVPFDWNGLWLETTKCFCRNRLIVWPLPSFFSALLPLSILGSQMLNHCVRIFVICIWKLELTKEALAKFMFSKTKLNRRDKFFFFS